MSNTDPQAAARLAGEADGLARGGHLREAAERFRQVLGLDPQHPGALSFLGLMAFRAGRLDESAELIQRALAAAPDAGTLHLNLALIQRQRGDLTASLESLEQALRCDPNDAVAQLHRGSVLAASGQLEDAAHAFTAAFQLSPALARLRHAEDGPPELRQLIREAEEVRQRCLHQRHRELLARLEAEHGKAALERIARFLRAHHGETPVDYDHPLQKPNYIYIPGLQPKPWFEREDFAWVARVEAAFADVREELAVALEHGERLQPYVDAATGAPREWDHLTDKRTWSSFHLLKGGNPVADNIALCPRTTAMLEEVPLVRCQGNSPEAFFSILQPGTKIPPHVGLANFKLAVHLALVIPEGCAIKVGGEERGWQEGRCLIFDDSFEHSAWNYGPRDRAVLIFEVWNPQLSAAEREAIAAIIRTSDDFYREMAIRPAN